MVIKCLDGDLARVVSGLTVCLCGAIGPVGLG